MTKALTNSQVFLNESTIELARDAYLTRWHLTSVQNSWDGKKPTLAGFKKRFGKDYEKRQKWLARNGQGTSATALAVDEREDVIQTAAERLLELLSGNSEVEDVEADVTAEDNQASSILAILGRQKGTVTEEPKEAEAKFVKPENFNELPRSGQVYFFLHRALEAGQSYAIVPLKRGVAAEAISQIKDDGRSYLSVASDLIQAK